MIGLAPKKRCAEIRKQFLTERANFLAQQLRTTEEKALRAILQLEESWRIYKNIKYIMGKQRSIFTQVDVSSDPTNPLSEHTTLTSKIEIKEQILHRNRCHNLLSSSIHPQSNNNGLNELLNGSFLASSKDSLNLSEDELTWIEELHRIVHKVISFIIHLKIIKKKSGKTRKNCFKTIRQTYGPL